MRRLSLIVALLVVVAACSSESDSEPSTTTTTAEVEQAAAEVVENAADDASAEIATAMAVLDAWEQNDIEALAGFFSSGATYAGYPVAETSTLDYLAFFMGLNDDLTIDGCTTGAVAGRVSCDGSGIDELSGPAGAWWSGAFTFDFVDGELVAMDGHTDEHSKIDFVERMAAWIRDTKPDVWEAEFVDPDCSPARLNCYAAWAASADTAAAMLELGEEYRATLDS